MLNSSYTSLQLQALKNTSTGKIVERCQQVEKSISTETNVNMWFKACTGPDVNASQMEAEAHKHIRAQEEWRLSLWGLQQTRQLLDFCKSIFSSLQLRFVCSPSVFNFL